MAEQQQQLVRQRAAYRGVITRQLDDIQTFLSDSSLTQLNAKLTHIRSVGEKLFDFNAEILTNITKEEDISKEIETACDYDEKCHLLVSELEACIASKSKVAVKPKKGIKDLNLPKLILPRFSGKLVEWVAFWDIFRSTVHEAELDNVRKFYYLRGQLDGPAKSLIEGFSIDDRSYIQAVELLQNTYGNKEQLKIAHVTALLEVEAPHFNVTDLASFRSDIECHTRSLKTLGTTLDDFMVIVMRQKLPFTILDKVRSFKLDDFKRELGAEISNLQLSNVSRTDIRPATNEGRGTMSMVVSHKDKRSIKRGTHCKLCDRDHRWFKCNKYQTPVQKVKRAKSLNLCTGCLSGKHKGVCTADYLRPCRSCKGRHFDQLCVESVEKPGSSTTTLAVKSQGTVSLPTVRIPMNGKGERVLCRALLDQCSQRTFIRSDSLNTLRHKIVRHESLKLVGFLGVAEKKDYHVAEVSYRYRGGDHTFQCVVVDNLPEHQVQGMEEVERALRRKKIFLSDPMGNAKIDILIGADFYYDIVHPGFRRVNDLNLIPTKFGYCISGRVNATATSIQVDTVSILRVGSTVLDQLNDPYSDYKDPEKVDLEKFWELDHIGIKPDEVDKDSETAIKQFESTINWSVSEKQYEVGLPWRDEYIELPSNYGMAKSRVVAIRNKLSNRPSHLKAYDDIFKEYVDRGFIEPVDERVKGQDTKVHYLPHHGVHKDSATTPIRVVFDCSARCGGGRSLNDCLLTGPSLVADLSQQLLRFRLGQFAVLSDIEKAFLMVKLRSSDRDVTRFLWYEDPFDPHSELITYRFTVVLFGATCSQFLLNATIKHHLEDCEEDTRKLLRGLYIDNLQGSSDTHEELLETYKQACRLFNEAHLNLREWVSNSVVLREQFSRDGKGVQDCTYTRVLGMRWETGEDLLRYIPRTFSQNEAYTKRTFLSKAAQFFYPLGLALPVTVRARILMQNIWRRGLEWDEELPSDLQSLGRELLDEYTTLSLKLQVPRYIASYTNVTILHGFCDASNLAYGAAVYLSNSLGVGLITAKAKVAPMKGLTIPKMELTSMLILGRLVRHVCEAYGNDLELRAIHVWSDSQITLSWVNSKKTLPVYVRNRVDEIKSLLPDAHFHYVKSTDNPSDLLTRGLTAKQLLGSPLWWHGPEWLKTQPEWPEWKPDSVEDRLVNTVAAPSNHVGVNAGGTLSDAQQMAESGFPWDRFSNYTKLIRVIGWIQRFAKNALSRDKRRGQLTTIEYQTAETTVIKMVQKETYASEIKTLNRSDRSKSCIVRQLNLFLADGLIRCKGRLNWSLLDEDVKHPILLPSQHTVTSLIVQHSHMMVKHYGVNHTVSHMRLRWWVPRARQVVKKIIRKCVMCQRLKKRQCSTGPAPDLPKARVQSTEPFSVVGVDYTGALRVKGDVKVYILLFTCAVTRAVHLELCDSMTTEDFMLAFRRFCARRSYPNLIYSDNAPTFHQAANYLHQLKEDPIIQDNMSTNGCEWRFIPVEAPWMGGMWERCVGTIKNGLRAVVGRALLTRVELSTILTEIEAVVNDRPITYVHNDLDEPLPLTPAHLLYGRPITGFPTDMHSISELDDPTTLDKQTLTRRYIYISKLIEDFRRRWSKDYLVALRERCEKSTRQLSKLKVGDVVLIRGDGPRIYWRMGRVLDLYGGRDQIERVALLKTATGNTIRPIARLYHLELTDSTLVDKSEIAGPEDEGDVIHSDVLEYEPQNVDMPISPQVGTARPGLVDTGLPDQVRINDNVKTRRAAADARALWRSIQASGQL